MYTYQKNVCSEFSKMGNASPELLIQISKQVFECENQLILLLNLNIESSLDCPFSMFYWLNSELNLDHEASKSVISILIKMHLAPSVIDFSSDSLVSAAILIALAKKRSVVKEDSLWTIFGQTFESVSSVASTFNKEIQEISIDQVFEGIPKFWEFNRVVEKMFIKEDSCNLNSEAEKDSRKRK